jgi:hypothetical protein
MSALRAAGSPSPRIRRIGRESPPIHLSSADQYRECMVRRASFPEANAAMRVRMLGRLLLLIPLGQSQTEAGRVICPVCDS